MKGKSELFENVNIDWNLIHDDHLYDTVDYSDDDLDTVQVCMLVSQSVSRSVGRLVGHLACRSVSQSRLELDSR